MGGELEFMVLRLNSRAALKPDMQTSASPEGANNALVLASPTRWLPRWQPSLREIKLAYSVAVSVPYLTSSISPGRQVLSNHDSNGPYRRRSMNQPLPGIVCTQLFSIPAGALGPK